MKVISIIGSPRKNGTSARIAKSFTDTAQEKGAEVKEFYLNGMTYRGCQGCEACHTKLDHCALNDDLTEALDSMKTADITVFSSPVYYADTSGQFRLFFDRTWSHVKPNFEEDLENACRLPKGKTAVFIISQAGTEDQNFGMLERYKFTFKLYGYDLKVISVVNPDGYSPKADVSFAQEEAVKLATELMKGEI